jgi:1-phosphatidylinositol-3-phosphate 5-kinase
MTLYSKVAAMLQKLKNEHPDAITVAINCGLSFPIKDFTELDELLIKEKASFEVGILIHFGS